MTVPTLPREFAKGNYWLGGCLEFDLGRGPVHNHVSAFLVCGRQKTMLIDTGHSKHWASVQASIQNILGPRPLDYIFPTHQEMPHSGNLPRLMRIYPDAVVCGNVQDYHLYYPDLDSRLWPCRAGDSIDLGDRQVQFTEAPLRDLPTTLWACDDATRAWFVADGYAFTHQHSTGQCALTAEELPELPSDEETRFINEYALYWTRYVGMDPIFRKVAELRAELGVEIIAPAHGSVIMNPDAVVPSIERAYP